MMIILAADHAGFKLKEKIKNYLNDKRIKYLDLGTNSIKSADYPLFAARLAKEVLKRKDSRGILFCGSGQGMAIAANRFKGIRASVCWNARSAKETRSDNDSNVLSLPGRLITENEALKIVAVWLKTPPSSADRHQRRIAQIDKQN